MLEMVCFRRRWVYIPLILTVCTTSLLYYYVTSHLQVDSSPFHVQKSLNHRNRNLESCINVQNSSQAWKDEYGKYVLFRHVKVDFHRPPSNARVELLLNIRKLALFAVRQLNERTKQNPLCAKWWANPLTTTEIYKTEIMQGIIQWRLRFDMEPGRITFEIVIRQNNTYSDEINLQAQKELTLISVKPMDLESDGSIYTEDNADLAHICICKTDIIAAKQLTMEARMQWNKTDPELPTWPLDASFIVSDYMDFLDKESFLLSPGKYGNRNTNYCGPLVVMIVAVHSASNHFELRAAIRETYGNSTYLDSMRARLVFFLGQGSDLKTQNRINEEAMKFDDIVQAKFVDSYHNITLKHLSVYQWIYLQCTGNASLQIPANLFKGDDDYFLNVDAALEVAEANPNSALIGNLNCGMLPVRDLYHRGQFSTPTYMYKPLIYPGYLSGAGYILRADLIPQLLQASLTTPVIHMEDAYITGLLARQVKAQPQDLHLLFSLHRIEPDACLTKKTVTSYANGPDDLIRQWKRFKAPIPSNCLLSSINFSASKMTSYQSLCLFEESSETESLVSEPKRKSNFPRRTRNYIPWRRIRESDNLLSDKPKSNVDVDLIKNRKIQSS